MLLLPMSLSPPPLLVSVLPPALPPLALQLRLPFPLPILQLPALGLVVIRAARAHALGWLALTIGAQWCLWSARCEHWGQGVSSSADLARFLDRLQPRRCPIYCSSCQLQGQSPTPPYCALQAFNPPLRPPAPLAAQAASQALPHLLQQVSARDAVPCAPLLHLAALLSPFPLPTTLPSAQVAAQVLSYLLQQLSASGAVPNANLLRAHAFIGDTGTASSALKMAMSINVSAPLLRWHKTLSTGRVSLPRPFLL